MMRASRLLILALALGSGTAAMAQLLPSVPAVGGLLRPLDPITGAAREVPQRLADRLAQIRLDRISDLVREHPLEIALDPDGNPARAGEVLASDPDPALIAAAEVKGFHLIERADALGISYARFAAPPGESLKGAIKLLRKLGATDVTADQLHFESGSVGTVGTGPAAQSGDGSAIGIIDGGVAGSGASQRGFATGAPRASDHGTAVASLIAGAGRVRGAAPGAKLYAADVFGSDPAGGSATAIARALAWLVGERVPVVTISLVGPSNPVLARVIAAAQARGCMIVAAVGNDGPAAPPSYPASYPGVIAVTAVDARGRILIEAGHATHLDYAAPGADMLVGNAKGVAVSARGTSFAAPLVAATIARAYPSLDSSRRAPALAKVDAGARRLGPRYGRGLVCAECRTPVS